MGKKKGNSKEAWLDWLHDEPPSLSAQAELRERFKQQANSYKPINRSQPAALPTAQPSVAATQSTNQARAVSQTPPAQNSAAGQSGASKGKTPATVSIQIHLPTFQFKRLRRLIATCKHGWGFATGWISQQFRTSRNRSVGICVAIIVVLLGVFVPPLLNLGGKAKTGTGSTTGGSAGADAGYEKPPFVVVAPSSKPKLATPDGVHAAYDGVKNSYSFSDSISGNGFTVSQQPIPPQFSDGQTAVDSIAPTLNKGVTPVNLKPITGPAYLSTNPKYDSQTVVASIRNLLIFIQSSHAFKPVEWENYLNTLQ